MTATHNVFNGLTFVEKSKYDESRRRIAELEKELAEAKAGIARNAGEYLIVHKDVMKSKDDQLRARDADVAALADEIASLERKPSPMDQLREKMVADALLNDKRKDSEIAGLRVELDATRLHAIKRTTELTKEADSLKAELATAKNAAKSQNNKEKRLLSEDGAYDKCGLGGIPLSAATAAAKLAESMLDGGSKIPFAAACLIVMQRELDKPNAATADRDRIKAGVKDVADKLRRLAEPTVVDHKIHPDVWHAGKAHGISTGVRIERCTFDTSVVGGETVVLSKTSG